MLRLKLLEDRFLGSFTKIEENFQEILGISMLLQKQFCSIGNQALAKAPRHYQKRIKVTQTVWA